MTIPKVLFVCLGNICRSPTAEAVFKARTNTAGLNVHIESAGTSGWHVNESPDPRSVEAGKSRGYNFAGQVSRKVIPADFGKFDYILAMDQKNMDALKDICPVQYHSKLGLFLDYAPNISVREVPDPYYGGPNGFDNVLDLIEAASDGLITAIQLPLRDRQLK